jgi:hypothetical protein
VVVVVVIVVVVVVVVVVIVVVVVVVVVVIVVVIIVVLGQFILILNILERLRRMTGSSKDFMTRSLETSYFSYCINSGSQIKTTNDGVILQMY